ncbi:sulfotransferase family protein [Priestia megaterium]|uniref:sulfotransferase family protein n=1 Tax=Priestia megaterium TaxID=1404 RepID=UPI003EEFCE66
MLPYFLIIGAMKCGTTSLYKYLMQHPNVIPAKRKEIHFFDMNYDKGTSWYKSQFPLLLNSKENFITGEASPYYLFHPHAARRIHETVPQAKLIVLLRNPVERAYSQYKHFKIKGSFEDAINREKERLEDEREKMIKDETYNKGFYRKYSCLSRGIYVDQLKIFVDYFGEDKILILKSEDLYKDPESTLNRVFEFLSLPQYKIKEFPVYNKNYYEPLSDSMRKYLADYFKPHNQRLYEYLGENFNWD